MPASEISGKNKACSKCGETKLLDDFYRNRASKDGRRPDCKDCHRAVTLVWERANAERRTKQRKEWAGRNPERKRTYLRRWRKRHAAGLAEINQRYRERHPKKHRAHLAVKDAIHRGELIKPDRCVACGELTEPRELHGHHTDYSKLLDVEWLCQGCHQDRHHKEPST